MGWQDRFLTDAPLRLTCSPRQDENLIATAPLTETNRKFLGFALLNEREKFASSRSTVRRFPQVHDCEQAKTVSGFAR